jgi:hypothetical protein
VKVRSSSEPTGPAQDVGLGWAAARQSVLWGLEAALSEQVDAQFIKGVAERMEL